MTATLRNTLVDALDDLASGRASRHVPALSSIERLIAEECCSSGPINDFLQLQDEFECNVASRLTLHLTYTLPTSRRTLEKASLDPSAHEAIVDAVTKPILQILNILQGMALIHPRSKAFLSRKPSIQTLLDILSLSRHLPSPIMSVNNSESNPLTTDSTYPSHTASSTSSTSSSRTPLVFPSMAAAVLDTLLCVLVDSSNALRTFEEIHGVEAVVKTLKRAGVAKDVRVKCLEFLYFYLLPEDGSPKTMKANAPKSETEDPRETDSGPLDRTALSNASNTASDILLALPRSNRSTSQASSPPSSPTKANKGSIRFSRLAAADVPLPATPTAKTLFNDHTPPPSSPSKKSRASLLPPVNSHLAMLRKEVEFVPMSPKKKQIAQLGVGKPGPVPGSPVKLAFGNGLGAGGVGLLGIGKSMTPAKDRAHSRVEEISGAPRSPTKPHKGHSFLVSGSGRASRKSRPFGDPSKEEEGDVDRGDVSSTWGTIRSSHSHSETPDASAHAQKVVAGVSNADDAQDSFLTSSPTKGANRAPYHGPKDDKRATPVNGTRLRTTAEKKEMLSAWLGNVDALVDGVQRAGVWGLA